MESERSGAPSQLDAAGWFGVEIRHFAALRALATYGSFRRAAESLGFTQSAVSQQIATLERRVQARLAERPRRGSTQVRLTPAGELLLRHGEEILARMARAREELASLIGSGVDTLSIGTAVDLGSSLVADVLVRLRDAHPDVFVSVTRVPEVESVARQLAERALDVAFYDVPLHDADLVEHEVGCEPFVLVVPAAPAAAERPIPTTNDLASMPVIVPADAGFRQVERDLERRGVSLRVAARSSDFPTTLGLVAAGVGAGVLPNSVAADAGPLFRALPIADDFPLRRIRVAYHRRHHLAEPARALVALVAEACGIGAAVAARR